MTRKRGRGKGKILTPEARIFKASIEGNAFVAKRYGVWPKLETIAVVELSYQLYDYKGDVDGVRKAIRDACEGVLYVNDRIVQDGRAPLAIMDGNGKRVKITVDVLQLLGDANA